MTNTNELATRQESQLSHEDRGVFIRKVESFQAVLNTPPSPHFVKANPMANGAQYVPIEILEMLMDNLFSGLWKTRVIGGGAKVIGNSVAFEIEVDYFHPAAQVWLTRAGSGAVQIQLKATKKDKNGAVLQEGARNPLDFEAIVANAIEKNAPAAKAMAFRNAVQTIGKAFGRDLNRDLGDVAQYTKPYSKKMNAMAERAAQEAEKLNTSNTSEQ